MHRRPAHLAAGAARIFHADIPTGARIRFRTSDPSLVAALHAWGRGADVGPPDIAGRGRF